MHDALLVHEVDGGQNLPDQIRSVLLRVRPLLNDPVKQLTAGHAETTEVRSGQSSSHCSTGHGNIGISRANVITRLKSVCGSGTWQKIWSGIQEVEDLGVRQRLESSTDTTLTCAE